MLDKTGFDMASSLEEHHPREPRPTSQWINYVESHRKALSAPSSPTSRTDLSGGRLHGRHKGLVGAN